MPEVIEPSVELDHPKFRRAEIAVFTKRVVTDCMNYGCTIVDGNKKKLDACCQYGCDVDLTERDAILALQGPASRQVADSLLPGATDLPLHGFAQNQIWCEIIALAGELLAWTQMLAFTGPARRWEPKRLRLRLFSAAGRLVRGGRRLRLRLAATWPWATQITAAITRLQALPSG